MCNAKVLHNQLQDNSIFLLLFFDAVHFSNSFDGKVWAILAIVLNSPLAIRQAFMNIIPILFWPCIRALPYRSRALLYRSYFYRKEREKVTLDCGTATLGCGTVTLFGKNR